MRLSYWALLCLFHFQACKNQTSVEIVDSCAGQKVIQDFLISNSYQLISTRDLRLNFTDAFDCPHIFVWIEHEYLKKQLERSLQDSLNALLGLPNFKEYAEADSNRNISALRLQKYIFTDERSDILIVDCPNFGCRDTVPMTVSRISFADDCNTPLSKSLRKREFQSSCLSILSHEKKIISSEQRNSIWQLMNDTGFSNVAYLEDRGSFCISPGYIFDYSSGSSVVYGIRHLKHECPGSLSPIYLVSEALLEMLDEDWL